MRVLSGCAGMFVALLLAVPSGAGAAYYGYHFFDTLVHGGGIGGDLVPLLVCIGFGTLAQLAVKAAGEYATS